MRRTHTRISILFASLTLAATAFLVTNFRDDAGMVREETTETASDGATSDLAVLGEPDRDETTAYRLGASAYFPQGTNPPIGSSLAGARRGLSINLEDARFDGDTVTAFGGFIEGKPECWLVSESSGRGISIDEEEIELAEDSFFYTAIPDAPDTSTSLLVHCELVGRPADVDEIRVEVG